MLLIIRGDVYKKVYNSSVMNNLMNKMLAMLPWLASCLPWVQGAWSLYSNHLVFNQKVAQTLWATQVTNLGLGD